MAFWRPSLSPGRRGWLNPLPTLSRAVPAPAMTRATTENRLRVRANRTQPASPTAASNSDPTVQPPRRYPLQQLRLTPSPVPDGILSTFQFDGDHP